VKSTTGAADAPVGSLKRRQHREGCGSNSQRDFNRLLRMALGSACALEYHLLLAYDLRMLGRAGHQHAGEDVADCKRMLASLIARVASDQTSSD